MVNIINLGTDCTMFHGFKDFMPEYVHRENGIRLSPFAGAWIYNPKNKPGDWAMNYGSLGIVADLINTGFDGWKDLGINFRGKLTLKKYPVEFTYEEENFNHESIKLFYKKLSGPDPIIFTSVWRPYIGFNKARLNEIRAEIFGGLSKLKRVLSKVNPDLNYRFSFFFVIDRKPDQEQFIKNLMAESGVKHGILYNEIDVKNKWRAYHMKFDCAGWEQALIDGGLK